MKIIDKTIIEQTGAHSSFPSTVRNAILECLKGISDSEYAESSRRKEYEKGNLDGLIFDCLTTLLPSTTKIQRDQAVSKSKEVLFQNDIEIHLEDSCISVEIEKGTPGRLELHLEKMRTFAHSHPERRCFGVFIVPSGNRLPSNVTGNHKESSYVYILRFGKLFADSDRGNLEDILVVGYCLDEGNLTKQPTPGRVSRKSENLILWPPDSDWSAHLAELAEKVASPNLKRNLTTSDVLRRIHSQLHTLVPSLRDKGNYGTNPYLGFAPSRGSSDVLYIWVQVNSLVIDLNRPRTEEPAFRRLGLKIRYRNNHQGRAGWMTGVRVPYNLTEENLQELLKLLAQVLKG